VSDILSKLVAMGAQRKNVQLGLQAAARIARSKIDALELFRPTEYQEAAILTFQQATEMLIKGGTRSGKSVCAAAIIASYLRNKPITFADGSVHHMREPGWQHRPVVAWLVGLQLNHIGQTLHRLLCRAGAFDIVRDKTTGLWRAWQPGRIPGDEDIPMSERKPAPPLIPPSEISEETWENKKEFKFTSLTLTNGSIAYGFASSGEVKRGDPINILWADEEIQDSTHYAEWQSRLSDRKGRILWTSWPTLKTPALLALNRRAEEQARDVAAGHRVKPDVVAFTFKGSDSPFIDEDEKRKRREGWSDAELRARDFGEFVTDTITAYPEFDRRIHCVDYGHNSPLNDGITEAMRQLNWGVPLDWMVELILDPGTRRPALLFAAIPPAKFWDNNEPYYIIFREIAAPRIDAKEIAARVKALEPARTFNRFIIDKKGGDQTPMGFSWKIREQYAREFNAVGLRCRATGSTFLPGEHVWTVRTMKLRSWMRVRPGCSKPQLRVVPHMCPHLVQQLEETLRNVNKEDIQDKLAEGQVHDVLDCLEYWAGSDPIYVTPPITGADSPGMRMFEAEQAQWASLTGNKKAQQQTKGSIILGIP